MAFLKMKQKKDNYFTHIWDILKLGQINMNEYLKGWLPLLWKRQMENVITIHGIMQWMQLIK